MRNLRSLSLFLVAGCSSIAVSACSGGGPGASASSASSAEETATSQSQALAATGAVVNYRHVKGVQQVTSDPGAPPSDAACRASRL